MAAKRLGRGLAALIPDAPPEEEQQSTNARLSDIEVSLVKPNPFQPRETFEENALDELKQSIAENGIIQPISVRAVNSGYELIAGERRLRAVQDLGLERIPAFLLEVDTDEQMIELSLIENIQRENLNPIEEALGYQTLITKCRLTQDEVAKKVGKDRSTITNSLRLLKLPEKMYASLANGEISSGHARALLSIENKSQQTEAWKKVLKEQLSVRQLERLAQSKKESNKAPKKEPIVADPFVADAEDRLRSILSTQVHIKQSKKGGAGTVEIQFYDDDDLERIFELFEK